MKLTRIAIAVGVATLAGSMSAQATNGYMSHGYSPITKAMGGAGAALPQDTLSVVDNPAGLNKVGSRADIGAFWFSPDRGYTGSRQPGFPIGNSATGGDVDSENNDFFIPMGGYSRRIDDVSTVGFALYGNGGMNTDYRSTDTFRNLGTLAGNNGFANPPAYQPPDPRAGQQVPNTVALGGGNAGVNLEQIGLAFTYARDLTDTFSLGASLIVAYQTIEVKGVGGFQGFTQTFTQSMLASRTRQGTSPSGLSDNGEDSSWGLGVQIGGLWDVNDKFSLGASYRSKTYMQDFDKYKDLFADGGNFDIPATATLGAAFRANDQLTFALDVQYIWYSEVDSIGNTNQLATKCDLGAALGFPSTPGATYDPRYCLGGSKGAGFGWDDQTVVKLGVQYDLDPTLTLRAGYSHASQIIDEQEIAFNVLAPAVVTDHWTLGATKKLRDDYAITGWFMYAPEESVGGVGKFTNPASGAEIRMSQMELGIAFSWLFD